eukprot:jgi/Bigna1/79489/fgenesh1_pg.62_\
MFGKNIGAARIGFILCCLASAHASNYLESGSIEEIDRDGMQTPQFREVVYIGEGSDTEVDFGMRGTSSLLIHTLNSPSSNPPLCFSNTRPRPVRLGLDSTYVVANDAGEIGSPGSAVSSSTSGIVEADAIDGTQSPNTRDMISAPAKPEQPEVPPCSGEEGAPCVKAAPSPPTTPPSPLPTTEAKKKAKDVIIDNPTTMPTAFPTAIPTVNEDMVGLKEGVSVSIHKIVQILDKVHASLKKKDDEINALKSEIASLKENKADKSALSDLEKRVNKCCQETENKPAAPVPPPPTPPIPPTPPVVREEPEKVAPEEAEKEEEVEESQAEEEEEEESVREEEEEEVEESEQEKNEEEEEEEEESEEEESVEQPEKEEEEEEESREEEDNPMPPPQKQLPEKAPATTVEVPMGDDMIVSPRLNASITDELKTGFVDKAPGASSDKKAVGSSSRFRARYHRKKKGEQEQKQHLIKFLSEVKAFLSRAREASSAHGKENTQQSIRNLARQPSERARLRDLLHHVQDYARSVEADPSSHSSVFEKRAQATLKSFASYMNDLGLTTDETNIDSKVSGGKSSFIELPGYF